MPTPPVRRVLYEVNSRTLAVAFEGGSVYIYERVPEQLVKAFRRAPTTAARAS